MCDSDLISRLYASVLHEDILKYHVNSADIRTGIQNMKEVYKPCTNSLMSSDLDVANYNDVAHRCAYLHKYAPFHTALVAEMLRRAMEENIKVFQDLINSGCIKLCSLGGGPGSDVIGVLSIMNATFGFFQFEATVIDCMRDWSQSFHSIIQELRYGNYGSLGDCVSEQYFDWSYIENNLLGKMPNDVNRALATSNLVTMIKFVSAAACKDTPAMIKKIFRSIRPGALVLYIDNAGGGFHQLVSKEARACNLITVFGPLKHEHYINQNFNIKRFGYTPCLETKVSVHIWRKPNQLSNSNNTERSTYQDNVHFQQPRQNKNQPIPNPVSETVSAYPYNLNRNLPPTNPLPLSMDDWQKRQMMIYSQSLYSNLGGASSTVTNAYAVSSQPTRPPRGIPKRQNPNRTYIQAQPRSNYSPNRPTTGTAQATDDDADADDQCCSRCVIS